MKLSDNDYNFDELSKALSKGGFDVFRVKAALLSKPERFVKHIRPMLEKENVSVFSFLMKHGDLFSLYERLPDKKENIWVDLVES